MKKQLPKNFKELTDDDKRKAKVLKRAQAVQSTKEEEARIISGILSERIKLQENYREHELMLAYKHQSVKTLQFIIDQAKKDYDAQHTINDENVMHQVLVEYLDGKESLAMLMARYNLELHKYIMLKAKVKYLKDALKNEGLTDAQIQNILLRGEYVKETPKKEEKDENTQKINK